MGSLKGSANRRCHTGYALRLMTAYVILAEEVTIRLLVILVCYNEAGALSAYPTELKRIRIEVLNGLSQENVAKRTSLTTYTYRRAEDGFPVKYSSAQEIKDAINDLLAERGLPPVSLEKLGINLE